ncbi:MAG: large subunit ribosomal protein L10 [Natronomonas sp.]|jgi:large subunit ribosomal protein L10|uniref:50S ribosomal protein L10 n=1 Tax=Natronomonas sp. TaxID=2184060 RepID=UPI00398A2252
MSAEAEAERKTETIPEWKREEVGDIVAFLERYESIGIVDVAGIPSRQLQDMRRELHGSAALRVSRNTLMERALEEVDDGLEDLTEHIDGQVGLIGTNENPFGLYQQLEESKTPAPINAGEVAPNEIVIPEGDTGVDPGPFVGELQSVGANARIEGGSIKVVEDSAVLDAGEAVSRDLANVLSELGIEPKEVGLDLRSVFSDGVLFAPEELEIDVEDYIADVKSAAAAARNLSLNAEYPTAETVPAMLAKAAGQAKSVGISAAVESPDLADDLVSKADSQMRALAASIDDEEALPEELRGVEAAPAAEPTEEEADAEADADADEEEASEEPTDESDAETDADTDEEDGDGGDALGDMFG